MITYKHTVHSIEIHYSVKVPYYTKWSGRLTDYSSRATISENSVDEVARGFLQINPTPEVWEALRPELEQLSKHLVDIRQITNMPQWYVTVVYEVYGEFYGSPDDRYVTMTVEEYLDKYYSSEKC